MILPETVTGRQVRELDECLQSATPAMALAALGEVGLTAALLIDRMAVRPVRYPSIGEELPIVTGDMALRGLLAIGDREWPYIYGVVPLDKGGPNQEWQRAVGIPVHTEQLRILSGAYALRHSWGA